MLDPRLIQNMRLFSSRGDLELYLDFLSDLIHRLGLENHDPRFHVNPVSGSAQALPLTINNRYICRAVRKKDLYGVQTLHAGLDFIQDWEVLARPSKRPFAQRNHDLPECPPRLMLYPMALFREHQRQVLEQLVPVCQRELAVARATPMRKVHSSDVYLMVTDPDFREETLSGMEWAEPLA